VRPPAKLDAVRRSSCFPSAASSRPHDGSRAAMSAGGRRGLRDRYNMPRSSAVCIGRSAARPATAGKASGGGVVSSLWFRRVAGQMPYRVGTAFRHGRWAAPSPGARTPSGMTRDQRLPLLGQATLLVRSSCVQAATPDCPREHHRCYPAAGAGSGPDRRVRRWWGPAHGLDLSAVATCARRNTGTPC
jgi:hypothetical protein